MITKQMMEGCGGNIAVATHIALHNAFSHYRNVLLSRHPLLMDYLKPPKPPEPPTMPPWTPETVARMNREYELGPTLSAERALEIAAQLGSVVA